MKTIEILSDTVCGGKPVQKGAVVDVSPTDAHYLIATGKAVATERVKKPKAKKKAPANKMVDIEALETRDAGE